MVQAMVQAAEQGIEASGAGSATRRRLTEMRDFYAFMFREIPALIERWKKEYGR
jgi:hypothetical protein